MNGPVDGPTVGDLDADHQRLALHGAGGAAEQPEHPRPAGLTCCGGPRGLPSRAEPAPPRPARRKDSLPRNQNGGTGRRDKGEGGGGGGEEGAEAAPCCGEEAGAVRAATARPGERAAAAPASAGAPVLTSHRLMASTFNRKNTAEAANQSQARTPAFVRKCGKSPVFEIQSYESSPLRRQLFLENSVGFSLQVIQSNTQKRRQTETRARGQLAQSLRRRALPGCEAPAPPPPPPLPLGLQHKPVACGTGSRTTLGSARSLTPRRLHSRALSSFANSCHALRSSSKLQNTPLNTCCTDSRVKFFHQRGFPRLFSGAAENGPFQNADHLKAQL